MGNCLPKAAPPAAAAVPGAPRAAAGSMRGGGSFRSQAEPRNGVRTSLRIVSRLALAAARRCCAAPSRGTRAARREPLRALLAASTLLQAPRADAPPAPALCAGQAGMPQVRQGLRAQVGRHAAEPAEALVRAPLRRHSPRGTSPLQEQFRARAAFAHAAAGRRHMAHAFRAACTARERRAGPRGGCATVTLRLTPLANVALQGVDAGRAALHVPRLLP